MFETILFFVVLYVVYYLSPIGPGKSIFAKQNAAPSAVGKSETPAQNTAETVAAPAVITQQKLPEDAVLRRHFLTNLQSEIEAALFPRPSDSILQRHYDTLVATELENRLAILAK